MAPATDAKGVQALALPVTVGIFTAVWAMEGGDCCVREGETEGQEGISRNTVDLRQYSGFINGRNTVHKAGPLGGWLILSS